MTIARAIAAAEGVAGPSTGWITLAQIERSMIVDRRTIPYRQGGRRIDVREAYPLLDHDMIPIIPPHDTRRRRNDRFRPNAIPEL